MVVQTRAKSSLVSRNVTIGGHRTSVRLEPEMWAALQEIARREDRSLNVICTMVDQRKGPDGSLTAAIRVFVMAYFREAATDEGHLRAGHGANTKSEPALVHDLARVPAASHNGRAPGGSA